MADAPEVKNPNPHVPDGVKGDTLDEVETPFRQPPPRAPAGPDSPFVEPPHHVPAGPDTDFEPPNPHVPDGIIGDDLREVYSPYQPPDPHVPDGVVGDVVSEVVTLYRDVPPHVPGGVVGDTIDEVVTRYVDVPPHSPDNVVGDSLDEVPQPPALSVPSDPAEPFDVPVGAAPPPADVTEDDYGGPGEPPALPDVFHTPAGPGPADEPQRASAPVDPFPVAVSPSHEPRSYGQLLSELASLDSRLAEYVSTRGDDPYAEGGGALAGPGSRALDPRLAARWLRDYIASVGQGGVVEFLSVQASLHAMNQKYGRVFDAAYLFKRFPILNQSTTAIDVSPRVHTDFVSVEEQLLPFLRKVEDDPTGVGADGTVLTIRETNVHHSDAPLSEGSPLNFGGIVDAAFSAELPADDPVAAQESLKFLDDVEMGAGGNSLTRKMVNFSRLFQPDGVRLQPNIARVRENQDLVRSSYNWRGSRGVVPAAFTSEDERFGYVLEKIPDDVAYMPLVFIDLRPTPDGQLRHVYFRALNLKTSEGLNPSWNEEAMFGRPDPTVGYQNTTREMQVSFACHAFAAEDIYVIYRKRAWLSSMVYPEISADSIMKGGPVVRMRVGDLYSNSRGGIPGVIRSINYDDSENVWELKNGARVPQGFTVSISFLTLHEGTPGVLDGRFTVSRLLRSSGDPGEISNTSPIEDDPTLFAQIMPRRRD